MSAPNCLLYSQEREKIKQVMWLLVKIEIRRIFPAVLTQKIHLCGTLAENGYKCEWDGKRTTFALRKKVGKRPADILKSEMLTPRKSLSS